MKVNVTKSVTQDSVDPAGFQLPPSSDSGAQTTVMYRLEHGIERDDNSCLMCEDNRLREKARQESAKETERSPESSPP